MVGRVVTAISVMALFVASVFATPAAATVSGHDGAIAFVSAAGGADQIYLINPDGTGLAQLTFFDDTLPRPPIGAPSWAPDGRALTFSVSGNGSAYPAGVWIINADGTGLDRVGDGGSPSWSPDGEMLALSKPGVGVVNGLPTSVIATYEFATGIETVLTDPGDWVHPNSDRTTGDWRPEWLPDGSSIVFVRHFPGSGSISNDALYSVDPATGETAQIHGPGANISDVDVHPHGDRAVFQTTMITSPTGFGYLTETSLTNGNTTQIGVPDLSTTAGGVSYAPSGNRVAATLNTATPETVGLVQGIWIRETDNSWRSLVAGRSPAWQPVNPYQVGLVDPATGEWHLRDRTGAADTFYYGNPGDVPVVGDWDCDGLDTPALYRQSDGYAYLRNSSSQGNADTTFFFGNPGDMPLAGDFNGDGCATLSVYRPASQTIFVINQLGTDDGGLGTAEYSYVFGNPGDTPFVGDFDGDGIDTVGLYRASTGLTYYRNSHTQGTADNEFIFGNPEDGFVTSDWNGDGIDTPGVYRPANKTFYLRFVNTAGNADARFTWGQSDWLPVAGNFTSRPDIHP